MPSADRTKKETRQEPLIVIISGPSGVGKDTVVRRLKEGLLYHIHQVITATTRPRRDYERDGVDYHFLSTEDFEKGIRHGRFLEWAEVYGNYYGVPREEIESPVKKGEDVVVKVDVQGAATLKRKLPQSVAIFLMPPSDEELSRRLGQRNSESKSDLENRFDMAKAEIDQRSLFDYVVVNKKDRVDETVAEIRQILAAVKRGTRPPRSQH